MCESVNVPDLAEWELFVGRAKAPSKVVEIAVCGKYVELRDAYKSIMEALSHAAVANDARLKLKWIDTDRIEDEVALENALAMVNGVLVPGGFGMRGVEGKIRIVRYARENKKPFLGICLGLQLLFESSLEAKGVNGLGTFKGTNLRFTQGKVPQIGWNQLKIQKIIRFKQ